MVVRLTWASALTEREADLALLTGAERARRQRLVRPADRARLTLGTALLRRTAGQVLGLAPGAVPLHRTCPRCGGPHGRPSLLGTGLWASISHSGERVLVAVTDDAEVGVDVELINPAVGDQLAGSVLGAGEEIRAGADLFRYWTRKEAVMKATGDGLTVPLPEVLVSAPDQAPALRTYAGRALVATLQDLDAGPGYAAALAVLTADPPAVEISWEPPPGLSAGGPGLAGGQYSPAE